MTQKNILAIDTSSEICSVALGRQGKIFHKIEDGSHKHGDYILPMIAALLKEAGISWPEIDIIGYGRGPGSFTGLRIAASVTQALSFAHQIPVVGVSSLEILAYAAFKKYQIPEVFVALDARKNEIYHGLYQALSEIGIMHLVGKEQVTSPHIVQISQPVSVCGLGVKVYQDILYSRYPNLIFFKELIYPQANDLIELIYQKIEHQCIEYGHASDVLPVYIRDNVVEKK